MIKRVLYIILTAVILSSCSSDKGTTPPPPEGKLKDFLEKSVEGIYVDGATTLTLDEANHQVAVNPTALTYRIQSDNQLQLLHTKLSSKPKSNGDIVTVTVASRGLTGILDSYKMSLEKRSSGRMWLWDNDSSTGIIINIP